MIVGILVSEVRQLIGANRCSSTMSAPVLSTPQDVDTFSYAKVNKAEIQRVHLDLAPGENYEARLSEYYSLPELEEYLMQTVPSDSGPQLRFRRVALQFPDTLICDSATVVHMLQRRLRESAERASQQLRDTESAETTEITKNSVTETTKITTEDTVAKDSSLSCNANGSACCLGLGDLCTKGGSGPKEPNTKDVPEVWILADTSYSSCCVDEVAAEHVHADLVVHVGDACLNPVSSVDTLHVFGRPRLDYGLVAHQFRERYPLDEFKAEKIVLMADAPYTQLLRELAPQLSEYDVLMAELDTLQAVVGYQAPELAKGTHQALGRTFSSVALSACHLFHVTEPHPPRLLQLTTQFASVTTWHNGAVSQGPFPSLMRRYKCMHQARAGGTIGVLVNTLSLSHTNEVVAQLGRQIKQAGKKHYVFVVGKPNVAKLANFEAVDVWCVVGCDHQGIILDTGDYYKPIVTPYELLLALGDEFSWTGQWVTEFRQVLEMASQNDDTNKSGGDGSDSDSDSGPEFDPVTGTYVSMARPLRRVKHLQISHEPELEDPQSSALVQRLSGAVALRDTVLTSAMALQSRHWTGLGSDWAGTDEKADDEGAVVEEGTAGIARGYQFDEANK